MPNTRRVPRDTVTLCPHCQRDLGFVGSWSFRGPWGYNEVHTYECPEHGPIFVRPRPAAAHDSAEQPDQAPDDGDRDSLIGARRKPTTPLNAAGIAVPEPDHD